MTTQKRLLIVSGSFPDIACGVSRHVDIIARITAELGGYQVNVLTSDDPAVNKNLAQNYQVQPQVKRWSVFTAGGICKKIINLNPDIVHIQNPSVKYSGWNSLTMSLVGPQLKRNAPHIRLVVMQHDIAVGRPLFRVRYRPLLNASDAVVVSNRRDYQAVADLGINPDKIYLAPVASHLKIPAPTPERKAAARKMFNIPDQSLCIAYFGFIHPGRQIDVLVKALHELSKTGRPVHGVIMGGPGKGARAYYYKCRRIAEHVLPGQVTWTGYAGDEQIINGLLAADCFVTLPVRGADMRNTTIHSALLAGLPVVCLQNPNYYQDPDLPRHSCLCINQSDTQSIASAIIQTINNPPDPDTLQKHREQLDPDTLWVQHVEINIKAYRGEPPVISNIKK
ncbi:MAG: glycosyltransferase family 4 protein [Sedimentisphaerales bacterium]|nr:glycosyltransferase family 4 protein [Sedimentisphaerales bacterium]